MSDEEKEFIKKINVDKAKKKTKIPIILIALSLFTYIMPLIYGEFDFGLVFEILSLIFLLIARGYMTKYDEIRSKRYIICSMVAIGWILIYDLIFLCSFITNGLDIAILGLDYYYRWNIVNIIYNDIICD